MKLRDLLGVYVWRENLKIYGKDDHKIFDRLYYGQNENVPEKILDRRVLLFEALTDTMSSKPYIFVIVK